MKKHLLIGIPCILLNILSFGALSYAVHSYNTYEYLESTIRETNSDYKNELIKRIENMKEKDKAFSFAIKQLKNTVETNQTKTELAITMASSAKENFKHVAIYAGVSALLTMLLILGLYPMFKKVSNKAIKKDV